MDELFSNNDNDDRLQARHTMMGPCGVCMGLCSAVFWQRNGEVHSIESISSQLSSVSLGNIILYIIAKLNEKTQNVIIRDIDAECRIQSKIRSLDLYNK
jgi:hypothetical protein